MSFQPGAVLNTQAFGNRAETVEVPFISTRSPSTSDVLFPIGKRWVNTTANSEYVLCHLTGISGNLSATWTLLGSASGELDTITTQDSTVLTATAGNINLYGAGSIQTIGSGSTGTVQLTGLTNHAVLVGAGNTTITKLAVGTTGQVLTGSSAADPAFAALGTNSGLTAHGVLLGENNSAIVASTAGTNGQVFLGSTGADPAFGTLTTSTGVAYTTGAASLAINLKQGGYKVNADSTGGTLVAQNSYTVTQSSQTSFALPTTAAVGDMFLIASAIGNTSGWIITQSSGQQIWGDTNNTTLGATGTLTGSIHDSVTLMCVIANTEFIVVCATDINALTFT